jgi:hypothetical protein
MVTLSTYTGQSGGTWAIDGGGSVSVIAASSQTLEAVQVHLGMTGNGAGFLRETLRLAEFSTPEAKSQARTNLELETIDCGTFN